MAAEQQVNLTDLEPIQLQEVKKQLDQVSIAAWSCRGLDFMRLILILRLSLFLTIAVTQD